MDRSLCVFSLEESFLAAAFLSKLTLYSNDEFPDKGTGSFFPCSCKCVCVRIWKKATELIRRMNNLLSTEICCDEVPKVRFLLFCKNVTR